LVLGRLGPVTSLAGLVLGFVALNQIESSKGRLQGSGLATVGADGTGAGETVEKLMPARCCGEWGDRS
jgi:hypothetical protein